MKEAAVTYYKACHWYMYACMNMCEIAMMRTSAITVKG